MPFCSSYLSKYQSPTNTCKCSQMIQWSRGRAWGIECSVITLLGGTSSLWWLVLWVVSSHQEICEGCSLLPFRSKLDLKTRQLCPSWNPKSVLLDLEFSSFAGENKQKIIISRTLYTASWKLEMTLRLVKLDRMIHLLLALFQSLSSFKEIFISQWSTPLSSFLLLSSKHLLCFMLGGEDERMWGHLCTTSGLPFQHNCSLGSFMYIIFWIHRTTCSQMCPPLLSHWVQILLQCCPFSLLDTISLSWNRTYSVELFLLITLHSCPSLLLELTANCVTPYCSTLHTQVK